MGVPEPGRSRRSRSPDPDADVGGTDARRGVATVTRIAAMRRRPGWVDLQLDGVPSFSLPRDEVVRLGLAVGDRVGDGLLTKLRNAADRAEAIRVAGRYLEARPRSRRELERRLARETLPPGPVSEAVAYWAARGYLDDRAFSAALARDRIRLRPCGEFRLRRELASRGVSEADAIEGIRQAFEEERVTEGELLDRAAARRWRALRGVPRDVATRRLLDFLSRRGFAAGPSREWVQRHLGDDPV